MKYTQVGFITFDSIATAMQCVQTLHQINPLKTVIKQAPDPNDINWGQLSAGSYERIFRRIITIIIVIGLFILWSIPVTFISALANIDNLSKISIFHFLINITQNHPVIGSLIDGFISSLALIIFMLLFPIILTIIEDWRGWRVQRERDCEILRIYWLFLIINVFLVTTIAGSIFTVLSEILKEPSKIPYLLAASLPQQSTVFINYIIVKGMVTNILVYMLRLPYFILCKLKQLFLCKTQREKMAAEYPDPFEYQIQYGQELLIFCISLTYSTMAPIISIFTTLYFILSYFWTKYNFIFVYLPNYEGIRMSHIVINRIFIGTLLFQITMLGVFSINYFPYGVGVIPLIIGTSLFWIYLEKRFWKPSKYLALEDCPPPDNQHIIQKARRTFFGRHVEITNITIQNLYTHPGEYIYIFFF